MNISGFIVCPYCGRRNKVGSEKCFLCGGSLANQKNDAEEAKTTTETEAPESPAAPKGLKAPLSPDSFRRRRRVVNILMLVSIISMICYDVFTHFYLLSGDETSALKTIALVFNYINPVLYIAMLLHAFLNRTNIVSKIGFIGISVISIIRGILYPILNLGNYASQIGEALDYAPLFILAVVMIVGSILELRKGNKATAKTSLNVCLTYLCVNWLMPMIFMGLELAIS